MKNLLAGIIVLFSFISSAQCLKGDCQDGEGTYKYDEGNFVGIFKNGDAFKGVFTNIKFSKPIVFEGYFIDTENGPVLDSTKKGKMIYYSNNEREGFITEVVTHENNSKLYKWVLNGFGEKKSIASTSDGFYIEKGNFINDILNDEDAIIIYPSGNKYFGGVVNGKRQGLGKVITPDGGIQQDGNWYDDEWIDANTNNPYAVPVYYNGNSIMVDVDFNGTLIKMTLDTGASMTLLNEVKFYSLLSLGQIKIRNEHDGEFTIANGDVVYGKIYVIDKMKIGNYEIENVEFSVLDENSSDLLGLNALLKTSNSFNIDVEAGELTFN